MEVVDTGYKMTEVGLIPSDWELKRISEVLTFGSGQDYKHLSNGDFPVYGTGGLMTFVNDFLYEGESVGIGRKGTIDKPVFLSGKFWTVDTLFYTHRFIECIPKFIYYKFLMIKWKEYNEASGVPSLNKNTLGDIAISIPTLTEQKAIATALSDVDTLISQLDQLIEKKKAIKQGAMQELLTGKTRLTGFENGAGYKMTEVGMIPNDWNIHSIGELSTSFSGGTPSTSIPDYYNGNINWITSSELNKGRIRETVGFISQKGMDNSSAKIVEKGTFLLAMYGATAGVPAITEISGAINQAILAIISGKVGAEYLFQFFSLFKERIINIYTQGGQPNLSGHIIKSINIPLPPTLTEQKAIATALSDMDSEIEDLETKREKYKQIKQGMMQELLTGKTRLV